MSGTLLEQWRDVAYDQKAGAQNLQKFWDEYFEIEKEIYEKLLANPDYINRNPCVLYQFWQQPKNIAMQTELIKTGDNNLFYAVDFDEIEKVVEEFNLIKIKNIGVDGSAYPLQKKINSLNKKQFNEFLNYHFSVCEEPSIIGNSMHGLLIAGKD